MNRFSFLLLALLFTWSLAAQQKSAPQQPVSAMESSALLLGKTAPLRDLVPQASTTDQKKQKIKKVRPPRNFIGRGFDYEVNPNAQPREVDAVRQFAQEKNGSRDVNIFANTLALTTGLAPNDPSGDIGKDYYVQAVNTTTFQIFDKSGNPASAPIAMNTLWREVDRQSAGDPIILYDQFAERWYITEFPPGNELLLAVSETSDPFGAYNVYVFGTPFFPDYPKWSIWDEAIVVTTNEGDPNGQSNYLINREAILTGAEVAPIQRILNAGFVNGPGFFVNTPIDLSGMNAPNAKPMVTRPVDDAWSGRDADGVDILEFDIDWADASNTTFEITTITTAAFDLDFCSRQGPGFGCVPQRGGSPIDGLPAIIMNQVHYQNFGDHESIVLNFTTDATAGANVGGIRWMELRKTAANPVWSLHQEGTFSLDDGLDRFMGGIAMDAEGNIALAYSTSSTTTFADLRVTGRMADDPLGMMTFPEKIIVPGTGPVNEGGRFGDYAQMSVDPADGRSFWFTSEYGGTNGVDTRIAGFNLMQENIDFAAQNIVSPINSSQLTANTPVTITVKNRGLTTETEFIVGYIFQDETAVRETITETLAPGEEFTHTFSTTVDMAAIGNYELKAFTTLESDQLTTNDTLTTTRITIPKADVNVLELLPPPIISCSPDVTFEILYQNVSDLPLTSLTFTAFVDGAVNSIRTDLIEVAPGDFATASLSANGLSEGAHTVFVQTSLPNGVPDEVPASDVTNTATTTVDSTGQNHNLRIRFDDFPDEISWTITSQNGELVASSFGEYPLSLIRQTINESICLPEDSCYIFNIQDLFGDGLAPGDFSFTNEMGEELFSSNGNFGFEASFEFCVDKSCTIDFTATTIPASAGGSSDGSILILAENVDPATVEVSINGGPFSNTTVFEDLAAGDYEVTVRSGEGCLSTQTITVGACALEATAVASNDTVTVFVTGATDSIRYSLDNENFQDSNVFTGLDTGTVTVFVQDGSCSFSLEVEVLLISDVFTAATGQSIIVYPNPTDGAFSVEMTGIPNGGIFLPIEVYDANGRVVQTQKLVRYDDTYFGHLSLVQFPSGMYYLRVNAPGFNRLMRVVKR